MYYENPQGVSVHDGFPNPATDISLQTLDLNQLLIPRPVSTFLMRITGNEWAERGIFDGDLIIVDRALKPRSGRLVIWWEGSDFAISFVSAVTPDCPVWGVVTAVIHQYEGRP